MATCENCRSADARQRERCPACLMWRRRHGAERPEDVVVKHNVRVHERKQR